MLHEFKIHSKMWQVVYDVIRDKRSGLQCLVDGPVASVREGRVVVVLDCVILQRHFFTLTDSIHTKTE